MGGMIAQDGNRLVLLLIDLQQGIDDPQQGPRNNPNAEQTARQLLSTWRELTFPIVHIRHDSTEPTSSLQGHLPGFEYKEGLSPQNGETEFIKHVNGAFTGTELESWLTDRNFNTLVICGLTTDHCVSTTAREAGDRGFNVYVVEDATAAFGRTLGESEFDAETIHRTALAQLQDEFAEIVQAEQIFDAVKPAR